MTTAPTLPNGSDERISQLLIDSLTRYTRVQRTKRRVVAVTAGVAVIVAASGFAWVTLASQAQQTRSAYCYSASSTTSNYTQVGIPDETTGPDGTKPVSTAADRITNAVEMCAAAWRAGVLGSTTVPTLVACVRTDNVPAIFPKDESDQSNNATFCNDLGLAEGK
ncbi:MAG TPA: hypothetical protein VNT53_04505 [Pseudolysinimonas sp.]|nr:hypothetical protein [Pseudolysinimonas sp.]